MVLMWMKSKAPWVIFTFGILILFGLLWMDQSANTGGDQRQGNVVGEVDGKEIPASEFQNELKNYLANEERRSGKAPEGVQLIQFREGLFNYKVQTLLMEGVYEDYQLHPSTEEMMDYVYKNPREVAMYIAQFEGPEALPAFMRDSVIDQGRFEAWLSQDSVYDRFGLRRMEDQLRGATVPQAQLNAILRSQIHSTSLEDAFAVQGRENKAKVVYYHVPADSFPVAADKFKDADLKAYFEANPDSFHFAQDAARLGYVRIPIRAAKADTALMLEFAKELKERAQGGEPFAELAKSYSGDPGSAEQGGSLGGFRGKEGLDPVFAAAAWSLDTGAVSDPVLTQFGYHVIRLNARKGDSADISHILLSISAGNETTDSLVTLAETLRGKAKDEGLEKAAQASGLTFEKTPVFDKSNYAPLGRFVPGVHSFAFSEFEEKEKVSEPLQAEDGVYLFERGESYPKGRDFERAKPRIAELLARKEKSDLAAKELEARKAEIRAAAAPLPARIGKAILDSTAAGLVPAETWLPGFGYASPALYRVFAQPVGEWGPVRPTDQGAAVAKVLEKAFLSDAEVAAKASASPPQNEAFALQTLAQQWAAGLVKGAEVENKLDMVFRN